MSVMGMVPRGGAVEGDAATGAPTTELGGAESLVLVGGREAGPVEDEGRVDDENGLGAVVTRRRGVLDAPA